MPPTIQNIRVRILVVTAPDYACRAYVAASAFLLHAESWPLLTAGLADCPDIAKCMNCMVSFGLLDTGIVSMSACLYVWGSHIIRDNVIYASL
jgi:hypothetical protein